MKFSQFIEVFVAALYNETELTGRTAFRISEILEKYGLNLNPNWRETLFKDHTFSSHVDARRHLGPVEEQQVSLSPEGVRWIEDGLGENVAEFLERNGAHYKPIDEADAPFDPEIFDPALFDIGESTKPVSSADWTGLPKVGVLTPEAVDKLKVALKAVDDAVERAACSNEEKAQARAYILAIHALAEAPEPPADLIWMLIDRANSISGIAAFFISIAGLFA